MQDSKGPDHNRRSESNICKDIQPFQIHTCAGTWTHHRSFPHQGFQMQLPSTRNSIQLTKIKRQTRNYTWLNFTSIDAITQKKSNNNLASVNQKKHLTHGYEASGTWIYPETLKMNSLSTL
jgi:hypothetical protein